MYTGMIASCIYIIINMLMLIELAYSWTEKIMNKKFCKLFWYLLLVLSIIFFLTCSIILTIYLHVNFGSKQECFLNYVFIHCISISCFVLFLISIIVASKTSNFYE